MEDRPRKPLREMTLEELWELFPIVLSPHRSVWAQWAREEMTLLDSLLYDWCPSIFHIGSTAIAGIWAKPTVDILVLLAPDVPWDRVRTRMEAAGYICMSASDRRLSFNKGYTPQGYAERVFHIHFHRHGDSDEILFRDYLNSHPSAARDYERLKRRLSRLYRHNRDAYTAAKGPFGRKILAEALR